MLTTTKTTVLPAEATITTITRPTHGPQERLYDFDMFNVNGTQEPVDNLHEA